MASAFIAKMVGKVYSYVADQYEYQRDDAKDKLTRLKNNLWKIPAVLHKASTLHTKDSSMESWLGSIKDAAYQAEDVLDLFDYRFLEANADNVEKVMANTFDDATICSSSSAISTATNTAASTSTSSSSTVKSANHSKSKGCKDEWSNRDYTFKWPEDEEYLSHFMRCAFGNMTPSDFPTLVKIGEQLAKKLAGSPLAAKTVGGELKLNLEKDHWEAVLRSKLWQIEQTADDIMPALRLSCENLPNHLKQCFVYFALFPKNHQHQGDVLIQMWRAHGYIQKETSDENAYRYINDLLQLSFIKKSANLDNHYVVHELLHDMAESVSNGEHFRIEDDFHVTIPRNVRHLYVNASSISKVCMSLVESQENLVESQDLKKNLRSLIICKNNAPSGERIHPDNFNNVLKETLHELRSLRVLVYQEVDPGYDNVSKKIYSLN
ncbi:hypothetical protein HU200_048072 [Digitaria exilis]|uniref:Rx N-terminal domain-containing protein n=1 Tax=Digitaria exilis TaxID=1010633 RepID=A0A835B711_9POAL|nr:hypothetical protein HU200_048072 [Digitaria exilis]